jgi:hypothetical protein
MAERPTRKMSSARGAFLDIVEWFGFDGGKNIKTILNRIFVKPKYIDDII